ncbi:biotin--[acetyl-CoA-carboxylase] ligase [Halalkaliarchaeum sp. AArc-GB]|uniref:biotin--[acetyl-CoA-carboxylase] ligase n=1 Tax=unclassified Halalkaliarchaeum TaxID=2678344 RepID=UPI00217E7008|nr:MULTISPECIES: biotin--[acetyl-CoA-carboxylase] ligase [unclassified Halalkaliarchaeum]MDR5673953.1 biotin--[acetyl-CoA-carboxylase] ligase [Halalkaliarchaeum sp. AArc-GB]
MAAFAASLEGSIEAPYVTETHESIPSTNERARRLAAQGHSDVAVIADEQTHGRGRRDRGWTGPPGGIYASILLCPDRSPGDAPLFTLAAAVAAVSACEAVGVDAGIKWPNDVIVEVDAGGDGKKDNEITGRGGRKLAGILTETETEDDQLSWLVVGIGINANVDPETLPSGATSLSGERGTDIDRRVAIRELLDRFYELANDPDAVLPAWRERAITLGRRVRVETADGTVEGKAVDVTPPGALVVETSTGPRTIHAGECSHLRRVATETDSKAETIETDDQED